MNARAVPLEIETITSVKSAAVLMAHPLRSKILSLAKEPSSATEMAAVLKLPRQKVNYHVRELVRAKLLLPAGERLKINMIERRYVATARSYVLSPEVLGSVRSDWAQIEDKFSAAYLLALGATIQSELGTAAKEAQDQGKKLATFSAHAEIQFETPEQRKNFTEALQAAISQVVAEHALPSTIYQGKGTKVRPYRLVVGCYPIPPKTKK